MISKVEFSVLKSLTSRYEASKMTLTATIEGYTAKECPILIDCQMSELEEAVKLFRNNNNIVGYLVTGAIDFNGIERICTGIEDKLNIIVPYQFTSENDVNLVSSLNLFAQTEVYARHLSVLIKLPDDFTNMKYVKDMCDNYSFVRFTGGTLLNLCGCRIGTVINDDLPKKIVDSKVPIIYEGEQSVDLVVPYIDMIEIEWVNKGGRTVKAKTITVDNIENDDDNSKPKKEKKVKEPKAPKEPKEVKPTKKSVIASKFAIADDDEF